MPFIFKLLRKQYLSASTAAAPPQPTGRVVFQGAPNQPQSGGIAENIQIKLDVLETITYWLTKGGGAQDALDDPELMEGLKTFLTPPKDAKNNLVEEVESAKSELLQLFYLQTSRPNLDPPPSKHAVQNNSRKFGPKLPDIDNISPEDLVENLDAMANTVFRGVTEEHMFELADMLEAQTTDRTGWFLPRDYAATAEDVCIQTIYSHVASVEPSPLFSDSLHHDSLSKLLSPSLRSVLRAHGTLRDWIISKITTPGIGLAARHTRLELALNSIAICRSRMSNSAGATSTSTNSDIRQPTIRSFVEASIVAAITCPESRAFIRAWQSVASARGTTPEDLLTLMPPCAIDASSTTRLTVDAGWLLERMLEVITLPDTVDSEEGHNLVNMDKRRYIYNLIVNAAGLTPRSKRASENERADMERLNNLAKDSLHLPDLRLCREEASREMVQFSPQMTKHKNVRPFQLLVVAQVEKLRRDRHLRDRLGKEKKIEQLRSDKRASVLNRAMQPQKQATAVPKHARNKKSMTGMSAFFRPISTAFTSNNIHALDGPKRTAAELDFSTATLKPHLVLNLAGAGIRNFINDQRPFTFQLDTEEGGHYLLQATTPADRDKWMNAMQKVAESSALKRLTFLGQAKQKLPDVTDVGNHPPADPSGSKYIRICLPHESPDHFLLLSLRPGSSHNSS